MRKVKLCALLLITFTGSFATITVPGIFGNGMVLQRNTNIPVWGWGLPNESITVRFHKQIKKIITDKNGKWKILLSPEKAGGPFQLTIASRQNTITFDDVLVGEVWLCSGQSNMEFTVSSANNAAQTIEQANNPMIRQIKILNTIAQQPKNDIKKTEGWKPATKLNVGNFTAVGYFFANEIFNKLHVPVGLINDTWGGTDVETWTSHEALQSSPEFKEIMNSIPNINLDSFANEGRKKLLTQVTKLQGGIPPQSDLINFKNAEFDDRSWPLMTLPGLWESTLKDLDGIVWFRKKITLDENQGKSASQLSLSMIDDNDETYINGILIGSTKSYNAKRVYNIPAEVLKSGENVIAVRVEDTGGGGGIYGDPNDMFIGANNYKIPLAGPWSYQVTEIYYSQSANPNALPSLLFNGMINPIIPYAIKGTLWYQGENNAGRAYQYRKAFPLMITDWRTRWHQGNFPFYYVQLASFNSDNGNSNKGSTWAELREAQRLTLSLPNTGMSVTTDIGEANDIHPKNKIDVGKRLAAIALKNLYSIKMIAGGPTFSFMAINKNSVLLTYTNVGSGLKIRNNESQLNGFEIAGEDKIFVPANAVIKGNKISVSSDNVSKPVAVRYAWADEVGTANLSNKEGFPAVPFRTDKWKGITEANKYHP